MAFELIASNRRACIDHCDELLFDIATLAGVPGPTIEHLWEKFYDGPRFTADESKTLASELRALHQVMVANPEIIQLAVGCTAGGIPQELCSPGHGGA